MIRPIARLPASSRFVKSTQPLLLPLLTGVFRAKLCAVILLSAAVAMLSFYSTTFTPCSVLTLDKTSKFIVCWQLPVEYSRTCKVRGLGPDKDDSNNYNLFNLHGVLLNDGVCRVVIHFRAVFCIFVFSRKSH